MSENDLLIWWIPSPNEMLLQDREDEVDALPPYIAKEVVDLFGRPLRGRLWVASELRPHWEDLDWDSESPHAARALDCGGVVIRRSDLRTLQNMPGFVTNRFFILVQELN